MRIKFAVVVILGMVAASCAVAQEKGEVIYRTGGGIGVGIGEKVSRTPVVGAPYTATTTNESVQILGDGNRITQSSTGTTARDSQGRTRQDAPLPAIGNMAAANAPHLVFIYDPVGQKTYTLNLTQKTAQSFAIPGSGNGTGVGVGVGGSAEGNTFFLKLKQEAEADASGQTPDIMAQKTLTIMDKTDIDKAYMNKTKAETLGEATEVNTEDLGTETMEGVTVTGTRTTKTIPAGLIGNEKPINIVIEVWTSPDLKTVVMSKRSDPRTGEQTFRLTNIVRAEPDASLFTVPADFKVMDGSQPVIYKMRQ
jgi:hypothetical protein